MFRMLMAMNLVMRLSGAYSSRYTAAPMPIGNASRTVNTPIQNVPRRPWKTPASSARERSVPLRNSPGRLESTAHPSRNTS